MFAQPVCEIRPCTVRDEHLVVSMPVLVLNIHSRCNCRCVMCDIWKREGVSEITAEDMDRHREALLTLAVRWVILSGGEPLLHGNLRALCLFFGQMNIRLTLLTTGLLLAKRSVDVSELFDDVIVSLDGPPHIHDSIRRVRGASQLIEDGVSAVHSVRPELKIAGRTTVQKANHNYLCDTVAFAKAIGLNSISFLAADLTSEAFNRPLLWPAERRSEIGLDASEVRALEQETENLIATYHDEIKTGFIVEDAVRLRKITQHFKANLGLTRHEPPVCNAPWVSSVVEPDGSVRPCFFHRPIGNINHAPLDEIVNGEPALSFRRSLSVKDDPTCQRCVCSLNYPREGGSQP
jgi:MoaA/NifB/PqqE/SkfB family radical SAM enzyme